MVRALGKLSSSSIPNSGRIRGFAPSGGRVPSLLASAVAGATTHALLTTMKKDVVRDRAYGTRL